MREHSGEGLLCNTWERTLGGAWTKGTAVWVPCPKWDALIEAGSVLSETHWACPARNWPVGWVSASSG